MKLGPRTFWRESALALTVFAALLGWSHRAILGGRVNAFSSTASLPLKDAVRSIYEMVYQEAPCHWTTAKIVKDGVFPAWTPYPEGGTPLIGKMQNGVFSPFHLHYYLMPARLMPWALTLTPLITAFFAFAFVYLYARIMRIGMVPSALGAAAYVFASPLLNGHALFADGATALFLPVLLGLCELHFRYRARWALLLLPWTLALPFYTGHFETALRIDAAAAFYFLYHLYFAPGSTDGKTTRVALFAAAAAAGAALACAQILPGLEYVSWSYNQVWRSLPSYGWAYMTVQKRLGADDLALTMLGLGGLAAAWFAARSWRARAAANPLSPDAVLRLAATAAAATVGVAALAAVGLDDTATGLLRPTGLASLPSAWSQLFWIFLALWGQSRTTAKDGLRALGFLMVLAGLILLKAPPLSNLLLHVPVAGLFNNTTYTPEFDLARAVLAAFALQEIAALARRPLQERKAAASTVALILTFAAMGAAAERPLRDALGAALGASATPWNGVDPGLGGLTVPPRARTFAGEPYRIAGWVSGSAPVVSVAVGSAPEMMLPAAWTGSTGARRSFAAGVPLRPGDTSAGQFTQVKLADGRSFNLPGGEVEIVLHPRWLLVLAGLAIIPAFFLVDWAALAAFAGVAVLLAVYQTPATVPADRFPLPLPALEKVKADPGLFRVDAFESSLLQADYSNLYGLQDIRNGGDNLDVLPMIYFLFLGRDLMAKPQSRDMGLKLDGLANVKYLIDAPSAPRAGPGLTPFAADEAIAVHRNELASPRASFFEHAAFLPLGDLRDFRAAQQAVFGGVGRLLSQPGFDPRKTLLLDERDRPEIELPAASAAPGEASVQVTSYAPNAVGIAVDAPRAGFVMLADNFFPGWTASINGTPTKIYRAWITFRAVQVPAGRSTIHFAYRPFGLRAGFAISILAILACLAFYVRGRGREDETPAAPATVALPSKRNKKDKAPKNAAEPLPLFEDPLLSSYALAFEGLLIALIAPTLLYWGAWALLIRR